MSATALRAGAHPRPGVRRSLLAALLVLQLGGSVAARADAESLFKQGQEAFNRKQFALAARLFEQAIGEQPRESTETVRLFGTWEEPYLPHYFLALSRLRADDCEGVAEALAESRRQGVILTLQEKSRDLARAEERWRTQCASQQWLEAERVARAGLAAARQLQDELATRLAALPPPASARRDALHGRLVGVGAEIAAAEAALGEAATGLDAVVARQVQGRVEAATARLGELLAEARALQAGAGRIPQLPPPVIVP